MEEEDKSSECPPLGRPLPLDEHACSVSMPTWSAVVGYEEGDPTITAALACGYPRFVYHPYVLALMSVALEIDANGVEGGVKKDWDCVVLPGRAEAIRCRDFLIRALGDAGGSKLALSDDAAPVDEHILDSLPFTTKNDNFRILDLQAANVHAVIFPAKTEAAMEAKCYWQHTGEVVSSRRAEAALIQLNRTDALCCHPSSNTQNTNDNAGGRLTSNFIHSKAPSALRDCSLTGPHFALHPATNCTATATDQHHQLHSNHSDNENPHTLQSFQQIRERIATITSTPSSSVFLTPSGMSAIYSALRSARRRRFQIDAHSHSQPNQLSSNGGAAIVYGFPYLDTLKMCSRPEFVPDGVEFFGLGDTADLDALRQTLERRAAALAHHHPNNKDAGIAALITEFPSNPLLKIPDLEILRQLADEYNFCLIVDDTIANFANVDLLSSGLADVLCTSLTKLFNGRGDAIAGSIITNQHTEIGHWMHHDLTINHVATGQQGGLWTGDAAAIMANSADFLQRSHQINQTAERLADYLLQHDDVSTVYYPKYTDPQGYRHVMASPSEHHTPGYGGLFSIILDDHVCQRTFYDKLDVCKGPSLGTNFTLVCPYTLLAHYHELDFAMSYGVKPNLLRIAVGLEDFETLRQKFDMAFQSSRLHPKVLSTADAVDNTIVDGAAAPSSTPTMKVASASSSTSSERRYFSSLPLNRNNSTTNLSSSLQHLPTPSIIAPLSSSPFFARRPCWNSSLQTTTTTHMRRNHHSASSIAVLNMTNAAIHLGVCATASVLMRKQQRVFFNNNFMMGKRHALH